MDYEALVEQIGRQWIRPGAVVIDGGAHSGRHTLPFAEAAGPSGSVWAFEPLAEARALLRAALEHAGSTVVVREEALGEHAGRVSFVVCHGGLEYSGLRRRVYDLEVELEEREVAMIALDDLDHTFSRLDLIKLDLEGGELGALRGARRQIERHRPVVLFECGDNALGSYPWSAADVARFWDECSYTVADILGRRLDHETFVDSCRRQEVWDYVAIPSERGR